MFHHRQWVGLGGSSPKLFSQLFWGLYSAVLIFDPFNQDNKNFYAQNMVLTAVVIILHHSKEVPGSADMEAWSLATKLATLLGAPAFTVSNRPILGSEDSVPL